MSVKKIEISGHPELKAQVSLKPLQFEVAGGGGFELSVGDVHVHIEAIPLHLRVPFLHRRVLAGSIGPFGVRMKPVEARVRAVEMVSRGVIGGEEAGLDVRVHGAYKASVEMCADDDDDIDIEVEEAPGE